MSSAAVWSAPLRKQIAQRRIACDTELASDQVSQPLVGDARAPAAEVGDISDLAVDVLGPLDRTFGTHSHDASEKILIRGKVAVAEQDTSGAVGDFREGIFTIDS